MLSHQRTHQTCTPSPASKRITTELVVLDPGNNVCGKSCEEGSSYNARTCLLARPAKPKSNLQQTPRSMSICNAMQ